MEDRVEVPLDRYEPGDVVLDEVKPSIGFEVGDVAGVAGHEVVHGDDFVTFGEQPVAQVAAQESRAARDQDPHDRPTPVYDQPAAFSSLGS